METKFVEVTNGFNWGKFLLGRFDQGERAYRSVIDQPQEPYPIVPWRWTNDHLLVLDIETGEGAIFKVGGYAKADLDKHRIWVCPMFEPFLNWLYEQDVTDLQALPDHVTFTETEAPSAVRGYRREGSIGIGPNTPYDKSVRSTGIGPNTPHDESVRATGL